MNNSSYVIGVDYGTDSVRSILVNAFTGKEIATSVFKYPQWAAGRYCDAGLNLFRQHPQDYIDGLEYTIKDCVTQAGKDIAHLVKGISIDTTGSTPVAVDITGTPLSLTRGFESNPNAMFILWKDHTAIKEAEEINRHADQLPINYLQYVGGIYSSEWFWAKLLHILRDDESIRNSIASFVEHCDWIPFLLTGGNDVKQMKRGVCSAGHKALWAQEYGGFPPNDFFATLDPLLDGFTEKLFKKTYTSSQEAGTISVEWANRLGLPNDVRIGVGAFDAHMGAVGGQIKPYYLSKVMGTSTCDMMVAPIEDISSHCVKGICGQVPGSIIPGMMGLEAGQSGFGDIYAWFKSILEWPLKNLLPKTKKLDSASIELLQQEMSDNLITELSLQAQELKPHEIPEISVDWMNGRRTPDANQELKGAITNISLGTTAPKIFYSLVEATCFGARAITERFEKEGVPLKGVIGLGGVARKSPFIMQMMANVLGVPIHISNSDQTCALGASMFAATIACIYERVEDAMDAMGPGFDKTYEPEQERIEFYKIRYEKYKKIGAFIESSL